mmetsp:Transcript_11941/g.34229  ORF Transcript_11941/g.34229 Transcript_11941/m.34229 type:complete len:260 (+) Transcript_11941:558-1337(+)
MAPHPAANMGSVVRMRDASVAGTLAKAIDSTQSARAVVTNPVYRIPPIAVVECRMGEKSGSCGDRSAMLPPCSNGDPSNMRKDATVTTTSFMADTGRAASGFRAMMFSRIKYPIPKPMGCAKLSASPMVGLPPAPLSSTMATPITATTAGTRRFASNVVEPIPTEAAFWTLHTSAINATNTQCMLQMTQDFDAVVDSNPRVCPRYPNATHEPHTIDSFRVSRSMTGVLTLLSPSTLPRRTDRIAKGASEAAATPKRLRA